MTAPSTDRNLLFGLLALQMGFVSRDGLIAALNLWALDKTRPFGHVLVEQDQLPSHRVQLLDALVDELLQQHNHDPQQCLASVNLTRSFCLELQTLSDAEVQASLAQVTTPHARDGLEAISPGAGPRPLPPYARFHILRPHARGGLGEVFVARDQELKREVALKEIQERHADQPESRSRFLLEAEVTGALEHPGIVPVYGLGTYADGRPFYAMRFIQGDSLHDAIAAFHAADNKRQSQSARSLALRQLLGRFVAVCQAISFAHSRGVIHRDLKPSNIMLGKFGETLVVDWGLAKVLGQSDIEPAEGARSSPSASALTQAGRVLGTPAYMSPEQAAGQVDALAPTSDVYSLGAVLYCLLTGRAPFTGGDIPALLARVQKGDFPPPRQVNRQVPAALQAICLKAMALSPANRYPSARALADDLDRWLADEPVKAYPDPWLDRALRAIRRHRTAFATSVALAVVGLVGLAIANAVMTRKNAELQKANTLADNNLASARKLALELLNYAENHLSRQPGSEAVRKQLTEQAATQFAAFYQQKPDDFGLALDYAQAVRMRGNVWRLTGDLRGATTSHDRAVKVLEAALQLSPDDRRAQSRLAETLGDLAVTQKLMGDLRQAQATLKQARELLLKMEKDQGINVSQSPRSLARLEMDLAEVGNRLGNYQEGLTGARAAVKALETLVSRADHAPLDFTLLCLGRSIEANALIELGQHDDARKVLHLGIQQAQTQDKQNRDIQFLLHTMQRKLASLESDTGKDGPRVDALLSEAMSGLEKLRASYLNTVAYHLETARAHNTRGDILLRRNDPVRAAADYRKARDLLRPYTDTANLNRIVLDVLASSWEGSGKAARALGNPAATRYFQEARSLLSQILKQSPDYLWAQKLSKELDGLIKP